MENKMKFRDVLYRQAVWQAERKADRQTGRQTDKDRQTDMMGPIRILINE
jgi:hypothetical protein